MNAGNKTKKILLWRIIAIALLCYMLLFFSCKKEELPVPKHDSGDVVTATVNMESNYKWQLYYDLKTNTVVGQNEKTAWDLGFESRGGGYRVVLNTSKAMFAYNTGNTNFSAVTDTLGFGNNKKWDEPSGNLDSTAIGDWRTTTNVYVIDRGYSETGVHQGFRKIQFLTVDAARYTVKFAQLDGSGETTLQVDKDSTYNFQFLSFTSNTALLIEPPKAAWDIVFTQYVHVFYNPTTPYLVTGCLLNRYATFAKKDSTVAFEVIDYSYAQGQPLSESVNTIGYDWKTFVSGTYSTNLQMNYIIKDSEGYYYKLHFIDFYNNQGLKGNPKWEMQLL